VVIAMYFKPGSPELVEDFSTRDKLLLIITALIVLLLGIAPQLLLPNII
jgi:NADH:ubiquinone oxidoreductase subunit 2 (subunit N)